MNPRLDLRHGRIERLGDLHIRHLLILAEHQGRAVMLGEFVDDYLGVLDPDGSDSFDAETFDLEWKKAAAIQSRSLREARQNELKGDLAKYIDAVRRSTDEIIVPTGQLFIEALPGSHPLLEDFKLLHRLEDVRKVKAEVRHAELENLRLAARVVGGQENVELLEDPDVDKKVVVQIASDGTVNFALVPNASITPTGTYTVHFSIDDPAKSNWDEVWNVAASPSTQNIGEITRV